jgi:tetratricopeptide (TPR) repeat protein
LPSPVARQPGLITALPTPSPAQVAESRRYREQGDAAFAARKYDAALAAYRGAIAADPTNVDARYHLGVTLAARGELPAAIAAWEGVLLLDASHERARENIERARRKLPPAAAAAADDAATLTRARQLVDDGRWASALALLDGALADPRHADDPALLSLRAEARLGTGDASGAIVDWLSVLAIDPRATRAYRGLADAYAVLGDSERAEYYRSLAR